MPVNQEDADVIGRFKRTNFHFLSVVGNGAVQESAVRCLLSLVINLNVDI